MTWVSERSGWTVEAARVAGSTVGLRGLLQEQTPALLARAASASFEENKSMRKRILGPSQVSGRPQTGQGWLDLEQIATIEVTSEEPDFPIESVFNSEDRGGWRFSTRSTTDSDNLRPAYDRTPHSTAFSGTRT
jgi:hypothetical protein